MNFINSLLIFTLTFFLNHFSVAFENTALVTENIYIDSVIQNYMDIERSLWNEINVSETRSNELVLKIRNEHNKFFSNETLAAIVNEEQKLKFKKYLNLSVFEGYVRDDQNFKTIANVILSDYNDTSTKELFDEIRRVFAIN